MALPLAQGTWEADTNHSTIGFSVRHLGLARVQGRFNEFTVTANVGSSAADTNVTAAIAAASVDTGITARDQHLQSDDFLAVDANPTIEFTSSDLIEGADGYALVGDVTLNGKSVPVTFSLDFHGTATFPKDQSTRAGFTATTTLRRKDFGIDFDVPLGADRFMIGNDVDVQLDIQLIGTGGSV